LFSDLDWICCMKVRHVVVDCIWGHMSYGYKVVESLLSSWKANVLWMGFTPFWDNICSVILLCACIAPLSSENESSRSLMLC
jgi:hypothetical protein